MRLHDKFLEDNCERCKLKSLSDNCGTFFRNILQSPTIPESVYESHYLCDFCQDLVSFNSIHTCQFKEKGLRLNTGGWATYGSKKVLRTLRWKKSPYYYPLRNLLRKELGQLIQSDNSIIVPVPIGSNSTKNCWEALFEFLKQNDNYNVVSAIKRNKERSTRKSVLQDRLKIASKEYYIDQLYVEDILGRDVLIIDDNVTTGTTLCHCAELIRSASPRTITLYSIERFIPSRILLRLGKPDEVGCPLFTSHNR